MTFTLKNDCLKRAIVTAIRDIYPTLPETFYGEDLVRQVNRRLSMSKYKNRRPYADSILRYFRELRKDEIKCRCVRKDESLYAKMD